jgi:hypothetical protein
MNAEHRPEGYQLVGERPQPAQHRGLPPTAAHGWHGQLDQIRCAREILGGQRVADHINAFASTQPENRFPLRLL